MTGLKVAAIGCGGHSRPHFEMLAAEPRVQLVALADLDGERLGRAAAEQGVAHTFTDYRHMLDQVPDLDVVHVLTMPGHLVPIVEDCLGRGLHTVVEKAPGMTAHETRRMADAARAADGKSMVSFNRRYLPQVLAVRRQLQAAGGAVHVAATYNKPLTRLGTPAVPATPDPVICDAIHHVDLIRWLAGPGDRAAVPVEVHGEVADGPRPGAHRHNAVVRFDTGAIGVLMSHYGVGYRIQRAEAHAEDLSAYLDLSGAPVVELYRAHDAGDGQTQGEPVAGDLDLVAVGGADYDEVRHFTDCILEDREPWSTLDDAVHTMRLAEAIRGAHRGPLA